MMQRNQSLTKDERTMYTKRLLKLHTILTNAPAENYNHAVYSKKNGFFKKIRTGCGTAACAIGHACLNADQFPGFKLIDNRALINMGINIITPVAPHPDSKDYFGPGSYRYIFHYSAYGKPAEEVTKFDAMQRIEDYITQHLGCKLIPA